MLYEHKVTVTTRDNRCCELLGPPQLHRFGPGVVKIPLRPELGVFKRKQAILRLRGSEQIDIIMLNEKEAVMVSRLNSQIQAKKIGMWVFFFLVMLNLFFAIDSSVPWLFFILAGVWFLFSLKEWFYYNQAWSLREKIIRGANERRD